MQQLSRDQLQNIIKLTNNESNYNSDKVTQLLYKINDDTIFDPEAEVLYYQHKDFINENFKQGGFTKSVHLENRNKAAVLCVDSTEYHIDYMDALEFRLGLPEQKLTTLEFYSNI